MLASVVNDEDTTDDDDHVEKNMFTNTFALASGIKNHIKSDSSHVMSKTVAILCVRAVHIPELKGSTALMLLLQRNASLLFESFQIEKFCERRTPSTVLQIKFFRLAN